MTPCGLQNIGNSKPFVVNQQFLACYFNSIIQIYYTVPGFVSAIMSFKEDEDLLKSLADEPAKKSANDQDSAALARTPSVIDRQIQKRVRASVKLILELKKLFAFLTKSDKKYADPSGVLHSIVDDYGNEIQVGEQKDMAEFNNNFLARVQEGLHARLILSKLQEEEAKLQAPADVEMRQENEEAKTEAPPQDQDVTMIDTSGQSGKEEQSLQLKRIQSTPVKSQAQRTQEEGGIIAETFFGQLRSIIQYSDSQGVEQIQEVNETFIEVMLNVIGTKSMYEAWENLCQNVIDGYETPENEKTQAIKVEWIEKLPSVISMQMNRLKYEGGNAVKDLTPMTVEPTIYPDRFMVKNRTECEQIRK
jgi:Ubiquitin carboxyl-terminal hydrolase